MSYEDTKRRIEKKSSPQGDKCVAKGVAFSVMDQLVCVFCLYDEDRKGQAAEPAITVESGNATCDEHLGGWDDLGAFLMEQARKRDEGRRS